MLTSAIIPLLVTVFSILSGLAVFYLVSNLAKEQKKKQAVDAFSHIINFVLFYRTDLSQNQYTGGSGLGLAISNEIVELHKGKIGLSFKNNHCIFFLL